MVLALISCAGCAALMAETTDGAEDARLATLPRVPAQPQPPLFPPEMRGLTFRVEALVDGAVPSSQATFQTARACTANFEQWMGAAGWIPVEDPSAGADVVIEEYCTTQMRASVHGHLVELRHPERETLAIVVKRDGVPIAIVPRGPADYVCESSGTRQQMLRDCEERAEHWAQAHVIESLIACHGATWTR
jgi:hypothetical protein